MNNIHILILAAGSSSRMNGIKQLLKFRNKSLLQNATDQARSSDAEKVFCVLGANHERIIKQINTESIIVLHNENWQEGLGSSLAFGIDQISKREESDGILVMLADQPLIDSAYLNSMIQAFSNHTEKIIASNYGKKNGVPALFPKFLYPKLIDLKGDSGAREIIQEIEDLIVSLSAGKSLMDIDTKEDYLKLGNIDKDNN